MMEFLFVAFVLSVAGVATLALWARQSAPRRFILVGLVAITFGFTGLLGSEFLSRPKPVAMEWRTGEANVIAHTFDEGRAIFLWLSWPDDTSPRAYVLPWSEETARQMEDALRGVEEQGGEVVAALGGDEVARPNDQKAGEPITPFERSLENRDLIIYATPPAKLPDQPTPQQPLRYRFPSPSDAS